MIEIKCKGADVLPLDAIVEFQGNLKRRTKKDIEKIITSIKKYGFSFPFFIWNGSGENYCLDGHGRIEALAEMRRQGVDLPLFPVVYVEAKDEEEAKQKLLRLNSQYGSMTVDSVLEFIGDIEIEFEELQLPRGILEFLGPEPNEEELYTKRITAPIYEITGENPKITDLTDLTKYKQLLEEIEKKDIPEEIKGMLRLSATRHIKFDYSKIAEFYAHAEQEVQELMENSALVIIDFGKAIEQGYIEASQKMISLYLEEKE